MTFPGLLRQLPNILKSSPQTLPTISPEIHAGVPFAIFTRGYRDILLRVVQDFFSQEFLLYWGLLWTALVIPPRNLLVIPPSIFFRIFFKDFLQYFQSIPYISSKIPPEITPGISLRRLPLICKNLAQQLLIYLREFFKYFCQEIFRILVPEFH